VRAVIHPGDRALYDEAAQGLPLLEPAAGGATRQDSVRLGLASLAADPPELVLIHDGVRALLEPALIDRVLDRLQAHAAVLPALPVTDTLKRVDDGAVAGTVDRTGLWRAQTPQGFRYRAILDAHRAFAGQSLTDDCALAEAAGLTVAVVDGAESNLKITEPGDLARAEQILAAGLPDPWPLERLPMALETSLPGVFAAGDVRAASMKRVASAVGEGAVAVRLCQQYIAANQLRQAA